MKEKEGFTLKKVITAVMAGAIVGYMLYEADVVDKVIEINQEQRIELCGPKLDHCPTVEPDISPYIHW